MGLTSHSWSPSSTSLMSPTINELALAAISMMAPAGVQRRHRRSTRRRWWPAAPSSAACRSEGERHVLAHPLQRRQRRVRRVSRCSPASRRSRRGEAEPLDYARELIDCAARRRGARLSRASAAAPRGDLVGLPVRGRRPRRRGGGRGLEARDAMGARSRRSGAARGAELCAGQRSQLADDAGSRGPSAIPAAAFSPPDQPPMPPQPDACALSVNAAHGPGGDARSRRC